MLGWIFSGFMALAAIIAAFFIDRDALKFPIVQMLIAIALLTLFVAIAAIWPPRTWFGPLVRRFKNRQKK